MIAPAAKISSALTQADREGFAAFLLRLRSSGFTNKPLETAIESVPRRVFADPSHHNAVWSSRMLPIECGEVLEGLDQQAMMLDRLELDPEHRVLEIGTGSGFTAAVMSKLVKRVHTVERFRRLHAQASAIFKQLHIDNVIGVHGDGAEGAQPGSGPFDRIISWAAFDALPKGFVEQLSSGGKI
ncbi:MAG: protein-L-isoaspartate O-methyltransferase, partial [Pseudomonadota bacterium]